MGSRFFVFSNLKEDPQQNARVQAQKSPELLRSVAEKKCSDKHLEIAHLTKYGLTRSLRFRYSKPRGQPKTAVRKRKLWNRC